MNTIVIIEDDPGIKKSLERLFRAQEEYSCRVIFLTTLEEAEQFLEDELPEMSDVVAITFDGSMIPGRHALNTLHLVRLAQETSFKGIMMACSSDTDYCRQLVEQGCTHCATSKGNMPQELFDLLLQSHS